jgi:hypothetical protein
MKKTEMDFEGFLIYKPLHKYETHGVNNVYKWAAKTQ